MMNLNYPKVSDPKSAEKCKVCAGLAPYLGTCDLSKWCSFEWQKTPKMGVPVHYHRCSRCGTVFSTSFDHFSIEDWAKYIYNEGYILVDGEYDGTRARQFAKSIHGMFGAQPSLRVIDYGGGNGSFADELRRLGWGNKQSGGHVETYDPFVAEFSRAPEIKADLLVSCEVLEHTSDPEKTWSEIASVCHEETVMVMTTLLAPPNPDPNLLDWWYIGPRNGHMTIFTQLGLATIARRHGFSMGSFSPGLHGFWRRVPSWAKSVFRV